jgi:hypothetical protein
MREVLCVKEGELSDHVSIGPSQTIGCGGMGVNADCVIVNCS